MHIHDELIEKYDRYRRHRYKNLIIIKPPQDKLFPISLMEEFAKSVGARVINLEENYKGQLNEFFIWQDIRNRLYELANLQATLVLDIEAIYSKWPEGERLAFLKNILLSEPKHPLVLLLNCKEDLSSLQEIDEKNRGLIWVPSK
jgi:hypothetical protein